MGLLDGKKFDDIYSRFDTVPACDTLVKSVYNVHSAFAYPFSNRTQ